MRIVHILAARPNFIKAAPVIEALSKCDDHYNIIVHTNQHYDYEMSKIFFKDLNIPEPDYHLGIKSGTHGSQTGRAIIEIEAVLKKTDPCCVVVYGDVNSTLAGAIAAVKLNIPIYHIESGCRSGDLSMPEEANRLMVDSISTKLFCTEQSAYENVKDKDSYLVGNTAIDMLYQIKNKLQSIMPGYYLSTLHRPFNVDFPDRLNQILNKLNSLDKPVIIPCHPRLENNIINKNLYNNIKFIKPLGYIEFISYIKDSDGIITDSGGVQCEAAFFLKPTITLRKSTEHKITLTHGNMLGDIEDINSVNLNRIVIDLLPNEWDGKASERIAEIINE